MTVIPDAVCKDAASLKYVEFPDTVKVIGNSAFYNCTALGSAPVEITLPENLETIRAAAFINTAISAITIPKTLKTTNMTIGNSGVFSDSKLNSIRFTEGMTKIPAGICKGAALLSSVEIPSSVTSIGSKAFANCEALKEIKFPDNLTEIGAAAFANTSITSVVIPKTVQKTSGTLGMSGIFSDSCLQSIQFEDGTACVPSYICSGAKQLTTVVIPQSVTSIGKYAFYQCGALTSLALPNMLADIGSNAFSGCTSLSVINWPETLSYIGKAAFAGTSITYAFIPAKVDRVRADTFMDCAAFCSVVILSDKIVLESTAFKNHPDNLVIHCNPDSSAFRFAENNQISCHSNIEIGNELKQLCTGEKEICILAHCNDCNKMFTSADILNAVGHVVVVDHEVPATCLETGLSEGSHCSVCGTVLVAQTEIPAAGHKPEEMPAVAPTCGTVGYTAGIKCGVCEEILDEPQAIPATGEHTPIAIPAEPATCTKNGRTEGTKCGVCGAVLIAPEAIPKTGHTVVIDVAVEATCTQDGLTEGSHCSVCGKTLTSQKTIPETGHQDTTREGERADGVCDICGERLEENFFQRIIHRIGRFFEGLSSFFKHLFSRGQRKKINTIS